jgi:hypothetical protein
VADLPLEKLCERRRSSDTTASELACWGDHFDVQRALADRSYSEKHWELLERLRPGGLRGQQPPRREAVCDPIDERHKSILPERVWGDSKPEERQARDPEMIDTVRGRAEVLRRGA